MLTEAALIQLAALLAGALAKERADLLKESIGLGLTARAGEVTGLAGCYVRHGVGSSGPRRWSFLLLLLIQPA